MSVFIDRYRIILFYKTRNFSIIQIAKRGTTYIPKLVQNDFTINFLFSFKILAGVPYCLLRFTWRPLLINTINRLDKLFEYFVSGKQFFKMTLFIIPHGVFCSIHISHCLTPCVHNILLHRITFKIASLACCNYYVIKGL